MVNHCSGEVQLLCFPLHRLHPGKLTWNLKINLWKRRFLFETIIFRFHVSFFFFWGGGRFLGFFFRRESMTLTTQVLTDPESFEYTLPARKLTNVTWKGTISKKNTWITWSSKYFKLAFFREYVGIRGHYPKHPKLSNRGISRHLKWTSTCSALSAGPTHCHVKIRKSWNMCN